MIKGYILLYFLPLTGQSQNLKIEEIMKGDEFGSQPTRCWSLDGKKVYFEWNPNNELGTDTYFWDKSMIKPQLTSSAELHFLNWILKVNRILISLIILTKGRFIRIQSK
jgi:hypothetical protein